MQELVFASAATLARAIRSREVSSMEVVEAHMRRIAQVNPRVNAVVQLAAETATTRAREADAALARGQVWGPLHGVPVTFKDSIDTAGIISAAGTKGRASYVPAQDAPVVARLRAAGAIVLGKTNTPELTFAIESNNEVYGRTNNPYDLARSPGGSSGGEAAAIAAGMSPLGVGSDSGGSIRAPCHLCGIAGLKPTSGRVPRTGHAIPFGGVFDFFTQLGPMARFVGDLAMALPLLAGPDPRDPATVPVALGDPAAVALGSLRGAMFLDNGIVPPEPQVAAVVRRVADALAGEVAGLAEDRPPGIEETEEINIGLLAADEGEWFLRLLQAAGTSEPNTISQRTLEWFRTQARGMKEFSELVARWDAYRVRMSVFMEQYDFILCPAAARPAVPHEVQAWSNDQSPTHTYTSPFNVLGWPALVVRAGTSSEGLPIAVQVAARPWREDVCLAVGRAIEERFGGWQPPPL